MRKLKSVFSPIRRERRQTAVERRIAQASTYLFAIFLGSVKIGYSLEPKLGSLNMGYASATPRAAALWIAKENKIFEKHGLEVNLVAIRGSATTMQALVGGDIDLVYVTGAAAVAAAGRGASVVIVATSGHNDYKILAHPSIASLQQLNGKTIGISNLAGSDYFALRRMLPKLGLTPGKDVFFLTTGIQSSMQKVLLIVEGRIQATLGSSDTVALYEMKGQKLSILADAVESGVYVTSGDIAIKRQLLKEHPEKVKAFLKAFVESIWIAKKDKAAFGQVLKKYLKIEDPRLMDIMYRNNALDYPEKPYPSEEAIRQAVEDVDIATPELKLKERKSSEFIDVAMLRQIEKEGFFRNLAR
jgi:ABC-type nitrate/sulfonate/bicarbonate transport system substrate-binding protein